MSAHANPDIIDDGLVLCLDAGDGKSYSGSGTTWYDRSGNNRDASKSGSQSPTYPQYNSDGYFTFTGGVNGNNYSRFDVTTPALDEITVFTFHYQTSGNGHILRHSTNDFQIGPDGYTAGTNYNDIKCTKVNTLNEWISDALTFDGINLKGYRNGVSVSSATRGSATGIAGGTLRIGARNDAYAAHYVGNIALVSIYDRVLSDSEVLQNYNALKSRFQ